MGPRPQAFDRDLVLQVVGPEVRIIDFYENHGQYADHYCSVVSARGYLQGKDFVPHDARVHEWGTGKTRLETLIALGRKPVLVPEHKIEDGINAAHMIRIRPGKIGWVEVQCIDVEEIARVVERHKEDDRQ